MPLWILSSLLSFEYVKMNFDNIIEEDKMLRKVQI